MRQFLFYLLLFCSVSFGFSAPSFAGAHSVALPEDVRVKLEPLRSSFSETDSILLKLTYTNVGSREVRLLQWELGLNGRIDEDVLLVTLDGEELDYRGRIYKRATPQADDYLVLQPKQSVSETVDLQLSYPIESAGEYQLYWRADYERAVESGVQQRLEQTGVSLKLAQDNPLPELSRAGRKVSRFTQCTTSQANQINAAVNLAEAYARTARDSLSQSPVELRPTAQRYRQWFGSYSPGRWAAVQNNFNQIYSAIATKVLGFNCGCSESSFAFVYPNDAYNMTLCNAFWTAPQGGTDSKAGTIIHEVSHFTIVARTNDVEYGQSACRALALRDPNSAITNADSHEYFAENTPFLSMPAPNPGDDTNPEQPPVIPEPEPEPEPVIPSYLPAIIEYLLSTIVRA